MTSDSGEVVADDLGYAVPLRRPVRRVVSLVPSLTEAIAVSATALLSSAVTLLVALGYSKEKAVLALQTSLAAPFADQPAPLPEGEPN